MRSDGSDWPMVRLMATQGSDDAVGHTPGPLPRAAIATPDGPWSTTSRRARECAAIWVPMSWPRKVRSRSIQT